MFPAVKRMTKLKTCEKRTCQTTTVRFIGGRRTVVSWGSNKGSILTALKEFPGVNFLHLTWMSPFPAAVVKEILGKAKHVIDVECNQTGQLAGLIAEKTGLEISDRLLKSNGRPIFPEEIAENLRSY
jgi:2-oxoglutarate ferredoxin oxidoreductase subunit alpha